MNSVSRSLFRISLGSLCFVLGCSSGSTGGTTSNPTPTPPTPQATLTFSATTLAFTGVDPGYRTALQTITVTNTGTAATGSLSIVFSGANPSVFSLPNGTSCSSALAVNSTCTLMIGFTPPSSGTFTAALTVTSNASNSPTAVSLTGTLGATAQPVATAKFAYAGNYSGSISMYTVGAAGALTALSPATVPVPDVVGAMVVDPLGKFVWTADFTSGNTSTYAVTAVTGQLTHVTDYVAPIANERPEQMAVDPKGRFLYIANTGTGTVGIFIIDRNTGNLAAGSPATVNTGLDAYAQPSGMVVDPSGHYLYVINAVNGGLPMYSINQTTGALTSIGSPGQGGSNSFVLRMDPAGNWLFIPSSRSSGISVNSVSATTGLLTPRSNATTGQGPADVAITPNGQYVYVVNRDDNTVSMYSFNETSGTLTALSGSPYTLATQPFSSAMDPNGQVLYVACEGSGVAVLSINADGTLTRQTTYPTGDSPIAIGVFPVEP